MNECFFCSSFSVALQIDSKFRNKVLIYFSLKIKFFNLFNFLLFRIEFCHLTFRGKKSLPRKKMIFENMC
jgi:hypothetical protein